MSNIFGLASDTASVSHSVTYQFTLTNTLSRGELSFLTDPTNRPYSVLSIVYSIFTVIHYFAYNKQRFFLSLGIWHGIPRVVKHNGLLDNFTETQKKQSSRVLECDSLKHILRGSRSRANRAMTGGASIQPGMSYLENPFPQPAIDLRAITVLYSTYSWLYEVSIV